MAFSDKDWIYHSNDEDLSRYHQDEIDLSSTINAGQRISDLRSLAEISIPELSKNSGISTQELLALEAGMISLHPQLALRLAEALGVGYSDLYVSDEDPG